MKERVCGSVTIDDVREFWNNHPLFLGESRCEVGTKEWFQEHEEVYVKDCFAGSPPDPIFIEGLSKESQVLDVGCGPGFWVRYFLRQGFRHVTACDLTPQAVELTKRSLSIFGLSAEVGIGNAEQLPYEDESFDHINCQGVIHHTPEAERCIQEFHRVVKRKGSLCLSVYHKNFLLRHPMLLKAFSKAAARFIGLKGRGRERLLESGRADEIVRMFDGSENPIGRAFTLSQLVHMMKGRFEIRQVGFFYFPVRALPIKVPNWAHRWLHRNLGLMIIIRGAKR